MARYIDADSLIEMLNNKAKTDLEMGLYNHHALTESFNRFVERQPTADVVPKSEADFLRASQNLHEAEFNEIKAELELKNAEIEHLKVMIELIELSHDSLSELYKTDTDALVEARRKTEVEVAREIFEEIEKYKRSPMPECKPVYVINDSGFAELKKKYTEERT